MKRLIKKLKIKKILIENKKPIKRPIEK